MTKLWWLSLTTVICAFLTGVLRSYALTHQVLDIPNTRSSHTTPMPRGGGIAITATFLAALAGVLFRRWVDIPTAAGLGIAGLAVAIIGFADDHRPIAARWRLTVHVLAAVWAVICLGGLPPLLIFGRILTFGWAGDALAVVYLVWLLNLYNFMDGIDGIAGLEAVIASGGAAVLYWRQLPAGHEGVLPALLAFTALGFLFWNWPPAKIFMGDSGSGFLGLSLGILSLRSASLGTAFLFGWLILLGSFVVDASVTLLRRWGRGEKLHLAHRSHAYQNAARRRGSHRQVLMAVGVINIFWLFPLAFAVTSGWMPAEVGILVAYAPLVWLALHFEAGLRIE